MKPMFDRNHIKEICVYTALTLCGLFVDLGTANFLVYVLSVPLLISGICGLITGTITNYVIHLRITFKSRALSHSWNGFWKYIQTCLLGAAVRLSTLGLLEYVTHWTAITCLIIATSLSFAVNYLLSRFYVFKPYP